MDRAMSRRERLYLLAVPCAEITSMLKQPCIRCRRMQYTGLFVHMNFIIIKVCQHFYDPLIRALVIYLTDLPDLYCDRFFFPLPSDLFRRFLQIHAMRDPQIKAQLNIFPLCLSFIDPQDRFIKDLV